MATNDDIRLKMTVSKMNIHRSTKLETIAVNCIVRNLDSFLDPQYSETRNVKLLPSALRNIVLQQWLMKHYADYLSKKDSVKIFEKRMKVFESLVSCHTLEVDLTPFLKDTSNSLAKKHLLNYLNFIGVTATNLKVLTLSEDSDWSFNYIKVGKTLCNAIGQLRNLKSLNIGKIEVSYTNLKAMCRNLEHLTHLSTTINFNPDFDESNQREIEDLQIFSNLILFEILGWEEIFTLNCIQHLPKLQIIIDSVIAPSIFDELLDRCPNQKFALTEMLLPTHFDKEIHLSFPDVTRLSVLYCAANDYVTPNSLLKFSKIENLTLRYFCSADTMIPFLDAYGHGLHTLRIQNCTGQFKLSSILDRCPKLQSLFLFEFSSILPECSRPEIHSFSTGLKELHWVYETSDDQVQSLLDILSVPTLECVNLKMSCQSFHLGDIERLTAMVASRQILGNLKRLKIIVWNTQSDNNHRVFHAIVNFIKNASAFLPHLTEIKTNIHFKYKAARMSSEASLEAATLKQIIDVYKNY